MEDEAKQKGSEMTNAFSGRRSGSEAKSDFEPGRDGEVKTMKTLLRRAAASAMFLSMFVLCLAFAQGSRCYRGIGTQVYRFCQQCSPDSPQQHQPKLGLAKMS